MNTIKFTYKGKIVTGQDGAIWGDYLFRFNHKGECYVYTLSSFSGKEDICDHFAYFTLDKAEIISPHSNSVMFGKEYFEKGDEFPLLYTNIYNNYKGESDPLEGTCLVYRIIRNGSVFSSRLVQMIKIGFTDNGDLWKSENITDIRPYGNFAIDRGAGILYAFTMRDESRKARFFSFKLPSVTDGDIDVKYNIKKVILKKCDIINHFDTDYINFMQGAVYYNDKIYSLEGFTEDEQNPPAMRIIDVNKKNAVCHISFSDFNMTVEPELIDFNNNICYYADNHGNFYTVDF